MTVPGGPLPGQAQGALVPGAVKALGLVQSGRRRRLALDLEILRQQRVAVLQPAMIVQVVHQVGRQRPVHIDGADSLIAFVAE